MKKTSAACLLLAVFATAAQAQTFTATAPGYSALELATSSAGYLVTAVATDGLGHLYYVESDATFGPAPARLWTLSFTATSHGTPSLLATLGAGQSGGFLEYASGQLYFGDSAAGGLYAINALTGSVDPLGTVPFTYDAAYLGGALYVSNNPGGFPSPISEVTKFTLVADGGGGLALSNSGTVLSTSEYSGPLDFTSAGELLYGSASSGLYRYSAAEVAAGGQTLNAGHLRANTTANSYLADLGSGQVLRDTYSSTNLQSIDPQTGNAVDLGAASAGGSLGDLDSAAGISIVSVTDYGAGQSRIYALVPEPSAAAMFALGTLALALRRRHKQNPARSVESA